MRRTFYIYSGFVFVFACLSLVSARAAQAAVNVNINFGPPPIVVSEPPEVVMMPHYGIYFVPGISYDVFFYNGYWWSPRGNSWYRARQYKGPWGVVRRNYVPGHLFKVPKNYREVYKRERRINYGQWKKQGRGNEGQGRGRGGKH
ncbi:MAG: hypothetical protein WC527_08780 [Candidatus Margulisiibacteriota bacterium]